MKIPFDRNTQTATSRAMLTARSITSLAITAVALTAISQFSLAQSTSTGQLQALPGELVVEPPTLENLGFEWFIRGDANRNASVAVSYRREGSSEWSEGLPLMRIGEERVYAGTQFDVELPPMFAGSIMVDYGVFRNVPMLDASDVENLQNVYEADDFDFRLVPGSAPVDKGIHLPNITDGFSGAAPDLGAMELGAEIPHYGPRS